VTDKAPSTHNTIVQHQLPERCGITRGDLKVPLTCRSVDRHMPPVKTLDIQRPKEVGAREAV
jgi:hypothetical protein